MRIYGNVAGRIHATEQRRHRQPEQDGRRCDGCGKVLPVEFFGRRSSGNVDNLCMECRREKWKEYKRKAKEAQC